MGWASLMIMAIFSKKKMGFIDFALDLEISILKIFATNYKSS